MVIAMTYRLGWPYVLFSPDMSSFWGLSGLSGGVLQIPSNVRDFARVSVLHSQRPSHYMQWSLGRHFERQTFSPNPGTCIIHYTSLAGWLHALLVGQSQSRDRLADAPAPYARPLRTARERGLSEWNTERKTNAILPLTCKKYCLVVTNEKQILSKNMNVEPIRDKSIANQSFQSCNSIAIAKTKTAVRGELLCTLNWRVTIFCTTWKIIWG